MADRTPNIPTSAYGRALKRANQPTVEQQQRARDAEIAQQQAAARALEQQKLEQQGSQTIWQRIGSAVGGAVSGVANAVGTVADSVVPDDSRSVPVLGQIARVGSATVDNVVKPTTVGALNTYDRATEDVSLVLSTAANAANPKYWQNRDPNSDILSDSMQIQPGRATIAAIDGLTSYLGPLGEPLIGGDSQDPGIAGIYKTNPDFNIADTAERNKLFDESLALRLASGTTDAAFTWFLDPGVIAGKGISVARRGTTVFGKNFSGFTARTTIDRSGRLNEATMRSLERELDQAVQFNKGAAQSDSPMGVVADQIVRGDYEELLKLRQFKGPNRDQAAAIGSLIKDKNDAINFLGASYGIKKYQDELARSANDLWVSMVRTAKGNPYETITLNTPSGVSRPVLLDDLIEDRASARAVIEGAAQRDPELAEALRRSDALNSANMQISEMPVGFLDYVGGSSAEGMRIAQAWRDGKQARKALFTADRAGSTRAGVEGTKKLKARYAKADKPDGTGPAIYERVFQASSAAPRIRLWDWVSGSTANGHINIRDFNDGKAADELMAALTDSSTVRKDKDFIKAQLSIFAAAGSSTELKYAAIRRIENNVIDFLSDTHGANKPLMKELYKTLDSKRSQTLEAFQKRGYAVDPDDGDIIMTTAQMRSQLANSMPMLNMRVLEKTAKIAGRDVYKNVTDADLVNVSRQMLGAGVKTFFDEAETLWKAGVLLRLGYTQRNVVEGWLRSAAYLGTIPAIANAPQGFANSLYNNTRRIASKAPVLSPNGKVTSRLKAMTVLQKKTVDSLNEVQRRLDEAENLARLNPADMPDTELLKLRDQLKAKTEDLTRIENRIANLKSRRAMGDNGAFSGEYADIVRRLSSAEQTTQEFLESAAMRNAKEALDDRSWKIVQPGDDQYWKELSNAIRQFRADEIGIRLLRGDSVGDIVAYIKSSQGKQYRNDMQLAYSEVEDRVVQLSKIIDDYIPLQNVRQMAAKGDLTETQLQARLGSLEPAQYQKPFRSKKALKEFNESLASSHPGRKLEDLTEQEFTDALQTYYATIGANIPRLRPIHGRKVQQLTGFEFGKKIYQAPIQYMFRLLGTLPETTLVRHPFYAEVWSRRTNALRDMAIRQGRDIDPNTVEGAKVLAKIDKAAHRYAMRATNETLYTIERYSNLANTFRWFSPFIAAWENSFKVWTKMIVNDPSIAARASILWDIPSQLGLIVDKDGNKVEGGRFDFLTGNMDQYIVLPGMMNDFFMKFSGGIPFRVPRSSFNFVTPGATPYLPGLGPISTFPVGVVLAQKPDLQAVLRENLGDALYTQIAPFGVPQNDLVDAFAPPWARRMWQRWQGESDQDWLKVVGAVSQSAMVQWYKNGADPDEKPEPEEMMQRANDFFLFAAIVSAVAPVSLNRISPYQKEIDQWNAMRTDPTMTYNEKVDKFLESVGEEFLPLTVSMSKSEIPGLDPTIADYKLLKQHSSLARELAGIDPRTIGIIASSAPLGEFDEGAYKWLNEQTIPGTTDTYRGALPVGQGLKSINMTRAWRTYRASKQIIDAELERRGLSSLQVKDAADLKEQWNYYVDNTMVQMFGEDWVEEFNSYESAAPTYLTAINRVLNDKEFMSTTGKSEMWNSVSMYMQSRQVVIDAIAAGYDRDAALNQFYDYTATMRNGSIAFSDFYDKFLDQDDFREIGLSNIDY